MEEVPSDVWQRHAAQWARVGPPLRPSPEDGAVLEALARTWAGAHGAAPRVLVLGVTPETARLAWPEATDLLAVDRSLPMIRGVWPGFPRPGEGALHADWLDMPLPPASRDLVVGDGCVATLRHPGEHRAFLAAVRRVLHPTGRFALRVFARPPVPEAPADVHRAVMAGDLQSFHAYKLRLLMAVQRDVRQGVVLGDVWRSWDEEGPGAQALAARRGWSLDEIGTIDAYRGSATVFTFPTVDELTEVASQVGLRRVDVTEPAYDLGERCPTLVFAAET